jgi:hypothetical protein
VAFLMACAGCLLCVGCIISPGAQVREALSQTKTYEWTDTGSIRVHGVGPQEEAFTMGEGVIVLNDDGTINLTESRLTHYLRSEPSADEAVAGLTSVMVAYIQERTEANKAWDRLLRTVELAIPVLAAPAPADEGEDDGG